MAIKKCKECGANNFRVCESIIYKASVNQETKVLNTYTIRSNEVEEIFCVECETLQSISDFTRIDFC